MIISIAVLGAGHEAGEAADGRHADGAGDDGGVGAGAGFFERDAGKAAVAVFEQFGGSDAAGDQDRATRRFAAAVIAVELTQQAVLEIFEIVHAFAHHGVARAFKAGAVFAADAVDGGFGGKAGADGFDQAGFPARIVREQAVGFEHVAAFAEQDRTGARQHRVDRGAQGVERFVEATLFLFRVGGEQLRGGNHGVVEVDLAGCEAFVEHAAMQLDGRVWRRPALSVSAAAATSSASTMATVWSASASSSS
jgi:hypothetical protein